MKSTFKKKNRLSPVRLTEEFDHKNKELLENFIDKNGKIKPRFVTRLTIKQQNKLAKSIKRARILNLMKF
tara:strand:+ start:4777 stop:4986 length:210 start_codon:yes stop_codon:yes gene_type:complete